jgi:hypothetical protein
MNGEILRREEEIDIMCKENQKLRESIVHLEQNILNILQSHDDKIATLHNDYKNKLKSIKQ